MPSNEPVSADNKGVVPPSTIVQGVTTTTKKSWAATAAPAANDEPVSFSAIMAQEEKQSKQQKAQDEHMRQAASVMDPSALPIEATMNHQFETEEDMIAKAIALSLQQETLATSIPDCETRDTHEMNNEEQNSISQQEKDEIEEAIRLADAAQESETSIPDCETRDTHEMNSEEQNSISQKEKEEIEEAIRLADAAQESESLRLALLLQAEEQEEQMSQLIKAKRNHGGNVKVMTRQQLVLEESSLMDPPTTTRLGHDDSEEDVGFQMNSQRPTAAYWTRRDKSTIVGPNQELRTKHDVRLNQQANALRLGLDESSSIGNRAFNDFQVKERKMDENRNRATKRNVRIRDSNLSTAHDAKSDEDDSGIVDTITNANVEPISEPGIENIGGLDDEDDVKSIDE